MKETLHIYTRVSTRSQLEGDSIKVQKDLGIKKADHLGMSYKIWDEENASSNHETFHNRPVMRELLFAVERGEIKHLFAFDDDRLSRNEQTQFELKTAFRRHGVVLYTNKATTNFDDPTDRLMKQIFDAFASYDNQMRTIRSRLGKIEKIKRGYWHGGPFPYGFFLKDRRLHPQPEESRVVKWIHEKYSQGESVMSIKKQLDAKGVYARRGDFFSTGSINKLLRNTHHKGYYVVKDHYFDETMTVQCPAIVSEELWSKNQERRKNSDHATRQTRKQKNFYLLTGLLHCGHCGSRLAGRIKEKKNERLYYCAKKQRDWKKGSTPEDEKYLRGETKSGGCALTRSLSIPRADAFIWHYVKEVVHDSSLLKEVFKKEVLENLSTDKSAENINKEFAKQKRLEKELQNTISTLADVKTDHLLSDKKEDSEIELFDQIVSRLNLKIDALKKDIDQSDANVRELRANRNWIDWVTKYGEQIDLQQDASPEDQKNYLNGLIERIDVFMNDDGGHNVVIKFNIGIVDDKIVHKNSEDKSAGYEVKEGHHLAGGVIPAPQRGRGNKEYPLTDYSTVVEFVSKGVLKPTAFLSFTVQFKTSDLWWSPYSRYQHRLANIIQTMRDEQLMTFPSIAHWLVENGYLTPRGHKFTAPHAHSIYKKSHRRSERCGRTTYSQIKDVEVRFQKH